MSKSTHPKAITHLFVDHELAATRSRTEELLRLQAEVEMLGIAMSDGWKVYDSRRHRMAEIGRRIDVLDAENKRAIAQRHSR